MAKIIKDRRKRRNRAQTVPLQSHILRAETAKDSSAAVAAQSKTHSFIDGYDNAVVHTNIHVPADAHPVRAARPSSIAILEGSHALPPTSNTPFELAAIPEMNKPSEQSERLLQRALSGDSADVRALADWANVNEAENVLLRYRLRKQQHEFASLFELVSATSARALDVVSLQSYMLRTVLGHFATPRAMIVRRLRPEDRCFYCTASQGLKDVQFRLDVRSPICRHAFERGSSFSLRELPSPMPDAPEVDKLRELGLDTAVPLLQEVDRTGAVLEGFVFIGEKLTRQPYSKSDVEFLDASSKMFAICLRNENLYRRSIVDTLTGVSSRGHFDAQLSQEVQRTAESENRSLCLIMLDVDHFKRFNDTYGHQTGDEVLKSLAKVLIQQVRVVDLVARYGGEEFAIICVETDKGVGKAVAGRLRNAVRDMEITAPDGTPLHVTASFGVASFPHDAQDMNTLIQMADKALYKSKDAGRDRVTMANPSFKLLPKPAAKKKSRKGGEAPESPLGKRRPSGVPIALELIQTKQSQSALNHAISGEIDRRGK